MSVALTTVPATVTCVRLQATVGSAAPVVVLATVTPNTSSATLNLGRLPAGQATISGTAYALACSDPTIGTTASPLWLADPVMATFTVGATVTVPLTFHINNPVAVSANFVKNVSSLSVGPKSSYAVMADATVKVTGSSGAGIGTLLTPGDLPGATSVAEVAVAASFACLRTKAGVVSCWGNTPGSASSIPTPNRARHVPRVRHRAGESAQQSALLLGLERVRAARYRLVHDFQHTRSVRRARRRRRGGVRRGRR